jgi:hypothetical protein
MSFSVHVISHRHVLVCMRRHMYVFTWIHVCMFEDVAPLYINACMPVCVCDTMCWCDHMAGVCLLARVSLRSVETTQWQCVYVRTCVPAWSGITDTTRVCILEGSYNSWNAQHCQFSIQLYLMWTTCGWCVSRRCPPPLVFGRAVSNPRSPLQYKAVSSVSTFCGTVSTVFQASVALHQIAGFSPCRYLMAYWSNIPSFLKFNTMCRKNIHA